MANLILELNTLIYMSKREGYTLPRDLHDKVLDLIVELSLFYRESLRNDNTI